MERQLSLTYGAFCRDRWRVYRRFCAASTGSASAGAEIARGALRELAPKWPMALQSSSPAAVAWELLSSKSRTRRTESVRCLHRMLVPGEADALLLRYRLGLSSQQAGAAMGLGPAEFTLLQTRALSNVTAHLDFLDMPMSHAVTHMRGVRRGTGWPGGG
ncbi:hypothetical protein [Streptomyces sp. NPDC006645]|uniref:hypothetical protein n=1 Tax=unclassified Streptomyces TaxID=2593676 RepID=UPI0033AC2EFC